MSKTKIAVDSEKSKNEESSSNKNLYVILIVIGVVLAGLIFSGFYYLGSQGGDLIDELRDQIVNNDSEDNDDEDKDEEMADQDQEEEASEPEMVEDAVNTKEVKELDVEETPIVVVEPILEAFEPQTYTNIFYPDFKLVYNSGWTFKTETRASSYDSLVTRNITLTKGDAVLIMNLNPIIDPERCGYGFGGPSKLLGEFGDGIREYSGETSGIYFGNFQGCDSGFILKTNINRRESEDYFKTSEYYDNHPEEVHFQMSVRTNISEDQRAESAEYQEIKQFLSESVFK